MPEPQGSTSPVRILLTLASIVVIIAGIKAAAGLLVPLLVAAFLTFLLAPAVAWLTSRRVPEGIAVALCTLTVVVIGIGVSAAVGESLLQFSRQIPTYASRMDDLIAGFLVWVEGQGLPIDLDASVIDENLDTERILGLLGAVLNAVQSLLSNGVIIMILVVFGLAEVDRARSVVEGALGSDSELPDRVVAFVGLLGDYIKGKTLMSLGTGICVGLSLWALGIDFPLLWGMLAFLLNYIPNIGSLIAAVPPVVLGLLQYGFGRAILVLLITILINNVFSNFLEPRYMGKSFGIAPIIVFVSFLFWAWVLGPVGMVLAVPLTVVLKTALEVSDSTRWVADLMR